MRRQPSERKNSITVLSHQHFSHFSRSHDYITRLVKCTERVWPRPFLAAVETKTHTCERLPCQEPAHVAQLMPQWTGGRAWCHPLPGAVSPAPYKDLHHMVLMVLSLPALLCPLRWVVFPQGWGCREVICTLSGSSRDQMCVQG